MEFLYYLCTTIMKEVLISLNNDFHEDCIFDFAELERKSKTYGHLMKHFSENEICDGKPYTFLDYEDIESYQFSDMEEIFSSYIITQDSLYQYEKYSKLDEINQLSIDDMESYENRIDCLVEESRYMHERKMNKIFDYIKSNF